MTTFESSALPTRSRTPRKASPDCLLDTSTAIALVQTDHAAHQETFNRLSKRSRGLAGHALFETYSVLTRLPAPQRIDPETARRLIEHNFPHPAPLSTQESRGLLAEFVELGISGGSVYDALVGCAAREHGITLVSRDRRAAEIYRKLGVDIELI